MKTFQIQKKHEEGQRFNLCDNPSCGCPAAYSGQMTIPNVTGRATLDVHLCESCVKEIQGEKKNYSIGHSVEDNNAT